MLKPHHVISSQERYPSFDRVKLNISQNASEFMAQVPLERINITMSAMQQWKQAIHAYLMSLSKPLPFSLKNIPDEAARLGEDNSLILYVNMPDGHVVETKLDASEWTRNVNQHD